MSDPVREALRRDIAETIAQAPLDGGPPAGLDALFDRLARWQAERVPAIARMQRRRGADAALPTDVFRHARVAAHPAEQDVAVFETSGTTDAPGRHPFRTLSLYDLAAERWARHMLFRGTERIDLLHVGAMRPRSSLGHMLRRFEDWFGAEVQTLEDPRDAGALTRALAERERPVAILGTSFALLFAEDALKHALEHAPPFALPEGSRVMHTGGFKGRTREVAPAEMRAALARRYGVPASHVISEYGMTELSSQAYETPLIEPDAPRRLRFPPWVRARVVDPITLEDRAGDTEGLLRVDDLANLDSCCFVLTADRVRRDAHGLTLLGRAPGATLRGCSLATEEALAP